MHALSKLELSCGFNFLSIFLCRSEISWLASTCRRKEKKRRVIKTYAVKKTACVSSQQFDMSAYDFESGSEDIMPPIPPKQKVL